MGGSRLDVLQLEILKTFPPRFYRLIFLEDYDRSGSPLFSPSLVTGTFG